MRIGELAATTGVSVRSLRYYEEQGLLGAERTGGGHRDYDEAAVARVQFLKMLYAAGMPSRKIADLLPFLNTGVATPVMLDHFDKEGARITARINALTAAHKRLVELREVAARATSARPYQACKRSTAAS